MAGTGRSEETTLFEAVIVPHRSLSRRGLAILTAAIVAGSLLTMLRFLLIGAWPVAVFSVIEVGLGVALLRVNARRGRASELILLSDQSLRIVRTEPGGARQETRLSPDWLNVVLEERRGRVPGLYLRRSGAQMEIGGWLGEDEKRDLARALADALQRRRSPVFDNPQLRD